MKLLRFSIIALQMLCCASTLTAAAPSLFSMGRSQDIEINNRVLAKVNGKPITLLDVVKKMDVIFFKQFPQYKDIPEARFQYYTMNWKEFLNDIIDKELIQADAQSLNVQVTKAELREEMENYFGPNSAEKLEMAGLTQEEAQDLVKEDMILKRVLQSRVFSKVYRDATPQAVRAAYDKYASTNPLPEQWRYRVISFRDKDSTRSAEAANMAHYLLKERQLPIEKLAAEMKQRGITTLNISEEFNLPPKEVSEAYRKTLSTMATGDISDPIAQQSRSAGGMLFRIFYMVERREAGSESYDEVADKIRRGLLDEAYIRHSKEYTDGLRKKNDVWEGYSEKNLPAGWQPFVMR